MAETEDPTPEPSETPVESVVLDLADLPLEDLEELPRSALGETLRRLREGGGAGDPFVTGYSESQ